MAKAKAKFTQEDDDLLAELGAGDVEVKKVAKRTAREERIIAGFEEIEAFWQEHSRLPQHGESNDIFERLYAVRLDQLRKSEECMTLLAEFDGHGLLETESVDIQTDVEDMDDDDLLVALGVELKPENDVTKLKHVQPRSETRDVGEVANRTRCEDFENFKPLFDEVHAYLKTGEKKSVRFGEDASIQQGEFFIVNGQLAYVAEVGDEIKAPNGAWDARLRVIYDNGMESNILMRSLQRALYKDEAGRRIITPDFFGPLFSDEAEEDDIGSGMIYVLRSNSEYPDVARNRKVLHKIGVTGGDINKRIANAEKDPTFLMAEVEVVRTYKLANINRIKIEKLIHTFFEPAKVNFDIKDRFGSPVNPREWFLVPLPIIEEAIELIEQGAIVNYRYDPKQGKIVLI